jgi:anti-sigma factor ChrR (cupin superfamily)
VLVTHLSPEQAQRYQRYALAPDEIIAVYAHLEACGTCRALVSASDSANMSLAALEAELLLEVLYEPEHLSDALLAALADGDLYAADREMAESHLERCASCRAEAAQLQALQALLQAQPEEGFAPLPRTAFAFQDTARPVTLDRNGTALLEEARTLPRSLAERVRELLTDGLVTPVRSFQTALDAWRNANLPAAALRGQAHPIPLSPVATSIRATSPILRWEAVPAAEEYTVLLAHQESKTQRRLLWKQSLQDQTEIEVPTEIALKPGALYVWQVTTAVNGAPVRSPYAWFVRLSDKEVQAVEKAERAAASSALALAGLYERYGLYEEALAQLQAFATASPDSPETKQLLERLRTQRSQD